MTTLKYLYIRLFELQPVTNKDKGKRRWKMTSVHSCCVKAHGLHFFSQLPQPQHIIWASTSFYPVPEPNSGTINCHRSNRTYRALASFCPQPNSGKPKSLSIPSAETKTGWWLTSLLPKTSDRIFPFQCTTREYSGINLILAGSSNSFAYFYNLCMVVCDSPRQDEPQWRASATGTGSYWKYFLCQQDTKHEQERVSEKGKTLTVLRTPSSYWNRKLNFSTAEWANSQKPKGLPCTSKWA